MPQFDDTPILPNLVALKANDQVIFSDTSLGRNRSRAVYEALFGQGFTHAFRIDFDNSELVAQVTNDTDEVITLLAIPANSIVDKARLIVTEAFTGLTACNIFVGRTVDSDGYIATTSALAITAAESSGAEIDGAKEIDVITAADQSLLVTFDPGANTEALGDLTAGSCIILVSLTEIADYAGIAEAQA